MIIMIMIIIISIIIILSLLFMRGFRVARKIEEGAFFLESSFQNPRFSRQEEHGEMMKTGINRSLSLPNNLFI